MLLECFRDDFALFLINFSCCLVVIRPWVGRRSVVDILWIGRRSSIGRLSVGRGSVVGRLLINCWLVVGWSLVVMLYESPRR